eukprot:3655046-Karenia_brevis.AAC.1
MTTLVDAPGINPPEIGKSNHCCTMSDCTEGRSFLVPVSNPSATWKNAYFLQYDRDSRQYT